MRNSGGGGRVEKSISPSLPCHPHRPVAAVSGEQLPVLALGSHVSVDASIAGTLAEATRGHRSKDQSQRRGETRGDAEGGSEGEAGASDCEMCLPSEIQLLSSARLLAASYSLSFCFSISPSRSTHSWLLLHGNHLLVSLSCSAVPVIHNIRPPHHLTPLLSHRSNTGKDAAVRASNLTPIPSRRVRLFLKTSLHQYVIGIPQLGRDEKCCLAPFLHSKCCCKGIFGSAQHYPPSVVP